MPFLDSFQADIKILWISSLKNLCPLGWVFIFEHMGSYVETGGELEWSRRVVLLSVCQSFLLSKFTCGETHLLTLHRKSLQRCKKRSKSEQAFISSQDNSAFTVSVGFRLFSARISGYFFPCGVASVLFWKSVKPSARYQHKELFAHLLRECGGGMIQPIKLATFKLLILSDQYLPLVTPNNDLKCSQ